MNQAIQDFIQTKRVAVIGFSRSEKKFGRAAYKELKARGYQVYGVNPEMKEIDGDPCYPNLAALQGKVDSVLLCVPSDQGKKSLQEAAQIGLRQVWVQSGAESADLISKGKELGLELITGKCILMYAPPVKSVHAWHRGFNRLFGKL